MGRCAGLGAWAPFAADSLDRCGPRCRFGAGYCLMARGNGMRHDGRSKVKRFIKLDHAIYDHDAYLRLGLVGKVVLFELIRRHTGTNNGRIAMPARGGERLGIGQSATAAALRELVVSGLVTCERRSAFTVKNRRAAEYGLAWLPIESRAPTLGWRISAAVGTNNSAATGADSAPLDAPRPPEAA